MQDLINNYLRQHRSQADFNSANHWLNGLHQHGLMRLQSTGFPTTRDEDWRYTNIKPLLKQAFSVVTQSESKLSADDLNAFKIAGLDSLQFVIVDGVLDTELSSRFLPDGLQVLALAEVLDQQPDRAAQFINQLLPESSHGFMDLSTAFVKNGVWIEVDKNVVIDKPVELIFITMADENALVQPRNLFIAAENSQLKIIERYVSLNDKKTMTNSISEIYCESEASLEHVRIQSESRLVDHFSGTFVKLESDCLFSTSTVTLGGNLTRNDLRCQIFGARTHCKLYGLYAANGRQHIDNFTQVEHKVDKCSSDELYKGVLDDRSHAVFHGRIYVAQDAQQTDAYQNNRTLLLSPNAEIDTKPQLEIYADDVKCSHGATIGQLNEEYLFYLCSRGIGREKARRMLTFAFVKQALDAISIKPVKIYLQDQIDKQLQQGGHYGKR